MEHTNECFNCGRKIVDAPMFTIVLPLSNETLPGGYVCDRCLHSVGQEISVYPLATSNSGRAFAIV